MKITNCCRSWAQVRLGGSRAGRFLAVLLLATPGWAATHYVDLNNSAPAAPYTSWATAADNIQDAVDVAVPGDVVLVTNGVYQAGARAVYGMNNRVAVTTSVKVQSVNGPAVTLIVGYQDPGTTNGAAAVRCVYLTSGAGLAGFTLTNGATQTLGDSYANQSGGGAWCESTSCFVSNCVLTGNSASAYGGGTYLGTLNNCTLSGNSAYAGGGAINATLNNCTLLGNSAWYGGGAHSATLNNCIIYYNSALVSGDNYYSSTLNYCCTTPLPGSGSGNFAVEPQLASSSHLSSGSPCRGAGSATYAGGLDIDGEPWANPPSVGCDEYWTGSLTGALSAAIVASYTNVAVGFTVDFQAMIGGRVSASRWDFGDGTVVSNRPFTSHAWRNAGDYSVELRAYNESSPGGVAANVTLRVVDGAVHFVAVDSPNPLPPYTTWATAATNIQHAIDAADTPGALVLVSNGVYQAGARAVYGMSNRVAVTKPLRVQSVNGAALTTIVGYQDPVTTNGAAAVRCVYLTNGAVLTGFALTNGATQTSGDYNINHTGGGVWCESTRCVVSNCVLAGNSAFWVGGGAYNGTLNHCTLTANSAYRGAGANFGALNHCTLSGNSAGQSGGGASGATLNNCTLTTNSSYEGGGVQECTLSNCVLMGNSVTGPNTQGGGAYFSTLNNCMLIGNSATQYGGGAGGGTLNNCVLTGNSAFQGGGATGGTLNNCTLTGNSAWQGGGTFWGTLNNCIVYYNTAQRQADNYDANPTLNYCCTTPLPPGPGNIASEPLLVSIIGWDNLRLQSSSPCINAGRNAYAPGPSDLDGNPRIAGGTVDIGAYEFQTPTSIISYAWLQYYLLPTDGSADYADPDRDGMNDWQEWVAGTDPIDPASLLRLLALSFVGTNATLTWLSVAGRSYTLERATDLGPTPTFSVLQSTIAGLPGTTSWTDTNVMGSAPRFYRVRVEN